MISVSYVKNVQDIMNLTPAILPLHLKPFIEAVFHYSGYMPDHEVQKVLPTGQPFLIFELDGITRQVFDNVSLEPKREFKYFWYVGVQKEYLSISAHQNSEMLVVQFKAYGAYPFMHIEGSQCAERILGWEEVDGNGLLDLRERILGSATAAEKLEVMLGWLISRFDSTKVPSQSYIDLVQLLHDSPYDKIGDVISDYEYSHKHLISNFNRYIGINPKYYSRIIRFNRLLMAVQKEEKLSWTKIAHEFAYTDQSHFIRDFKHFFGINPSQYIQNEYHKQEQNFFPVR